MPSSEMRKVWPGELYAGDIVFHRGITMRVAEMPYRLVPAGQVPLEECLKDENGCFPVVCVPLDDIER